jgi:hypothetical protein
MEYKEFKPHTDLQSIVKCYWTLTVPAQKDTQKQLVLPDGCIEMFFILGDDVKRYTSGKNYIIQPREMVLGQITKPFHIEPTGEVKTFAIRFYPYGFANFVKKEIKQLANKETPISELFGKDASNKITLLINKAKSTKKRIELIEDFLLKILNKPATIDSIVKSTIDKMIISGGTKPIKKLLEEDLSKRRQLERKFIRQIGISPKQLGKVIRLQATLQMLLNKQDGTLTNIAYENEYFDQAHFIKDFKEFAGVTPKEFLTDGNMALSSLIYKNQ